MSTRDEFLERLDVIEARLAAAAASEPAPGALTDADPSSGERWDRGQVCAHLAEFIPYWIEQTRPVISGQPSGAPVRFGRTRNDPERIGAIERDRREPVTELWAATASTSPSFALFLWSCRRISGWRLLPLHREWSGRVPSYSPARWGREVAITSPTAEDNVTRETEAPDHG